MTPNYYLYIVYKDESTEFTIFETKEKMNLYLLSSDEDTIRYMHIVSGFTLEEREND